MNGVVWVVDDSAPMRDSLAVLLGLNGIPAVAIPSTAEAAARLRVGDTPRAMLLDLHMPNGGNTLLEDIQANAEWTFPILVLTGYGKDSLNETVRNRVYRTLEKSGDPQEIIDHVRRSLGINT